jgi:hypothetical protein
VTALPSLMSLVTALPDKQIPIVVYGASKNCQDTVALDKLGRADSEQVSFLKGGLKLSK